MHVYLRGDWKQRLRLASGLVLFAFAATHFLNHALGLVGLEVMHQAQAWRTAVTRSVPGSFVLLAALVTHIALALTKLARRTTWRLPRWEAVQISFGLAIPFLLLPHIVNTRIAHTFFAVEDSYLYELARLWPGSAVQQSALLVLVWAHGCIGLHYWLRLSPLYRSMAPALLVVAVLLPLAAIAGFAVAGTITSDVMSDPDALAALKARSRWPDAAASEQLAWWRFALRAGFGFAALAAVTVAIARARRELRRDTRASVTYADGRTVFLQPGQTILEASRAAGIAHASVCGGRGRCSTCRVRIEQGLDTLAPPDDGEALTLRAIEAPANVRLACQVRPTSKVVVALISAPGTRSPLEREFAVVKEVVACHVRAGLTSQQIELASGLDGTVGAWLEQRVGHAFRPPRFADPALVLVGARLDYVGTTSVGVVVFARGDAFASVFVIPRDPASLEQLRATRNGYHVLGWVDDQSCFIAVADPGLVGITPIEQVAAEVDIVDVEQRIRRSRSSGNTQADGLPIDVPEGVTLI